MIPNFERTVQSADILIRSLAVQLKINESQLFAEQFQCFFVVPIVVDFFGDVPFDFSLKKFGRAVVVQTSGLHVVHQGTPFSSVLATKNLVKTSGCLLCAFFCFVC